MKSSTYDHTLFQGQCPQNQSIINTEANTKETTALYSSNLKTH
jgi:hypothetical protein